MSKKDAKGRKLLRKKKLEDAIKHDNIEFDVCSLLKSEPLTSKPEVGDFLKKYIKSIRLFVDHSKITVYPIIQLYVIKIFIDFLDGHQILVEICPEGFECSLWKNVEEEKLCVNEQKYIIDFVNKLKDYSFLKI